MCKRNINVGVNVGLEISKEVFQLAQNQQANITGRTAITSGLGVEFPLEFQLGKKGVCIETQRVQDDHSRSMCNNHPLEM